MDEHFGGWIGMAVAGLLALRSLVELARTLIEKKRRQPLIRQADKDRKDYIRQLEALTAKVDALSPKVTELEGWKDGVTGEYRIPKFPTKAGE